MPFVNLKCSVELNNKEEIKSVLGKLIEIIPGKTEARTMVNIEDKKDLYFGGSKEACLLVETIVNKETDLSTEKEYCTTLIDQLSQLCSVKRTRIYTLVTKEDFWYSVKE